MCENKLFILMYCIPMTPTGQNFQFLIFYASHRTRRNFCGKFIFHVELDREILKKCSAILVVYSMTLEKQMIIKTYRQDLREFINNNEIRIYAGKKVDLPPIPEDILNIVLQYKKQSI